MVSDIQSKLYNKVLPILERHLTEATTSSEDSPVIRSFVVLSIARTLRHLPRHNCQHGRQKLVSTIVSKGLRQKDLTCKEKGRKALLRLIEELSPRTPILTLVFSDMKDQL